MVGASVKFGNRWCFACHKKAHDTWLVVITCCHRIDGLRGESKLSCSQNLGCNHKRRSAEKNGRKMLAHRWIHREWLRGGVLWYGSAKVKRRNLSLCSRMITLQLINLPQIVASDKGQEFDILINCHNSRSPCPTLNGIDMCAWWAKCGFQTNTAVHAYVMCCCEFSGCWVCTVFLCVSQGGVASSKEARKKQEKWCKTSRIFVLNIEYRISVPSCRFYETSLFAGGHGT